MVLSQWKISTMGCSFSRSTRNCVPFPYFCCLKVAKSKTFFESTQSIYIYFRFRIDGYCIRVKYFYIHIFMYTHDIFPEYFVHGGLI